METNNPALRKLLKWARQRVGELIAEKVHLMKEDKSVTWTVPADIVENILAISGEGVLATSIHRLYSIPVLDSTGEATYNSDGTMILKESIPLQVIVKIISDKRS